MKKLIIPVLALVAGVAFAETSEVKLWRGETTALRLADFAEIGEVPSGIKVRVGGLMPVYYHAPRKDHDVKISLDRVDYTANAGARYVEVAAAVDAKPGVYDIGKLRVTVIDRVLPPAKEWKYYLDLWQHPWAVSRYFQLKPFSSEHYAKMRPLWEMLGNAGQKVLTTTLLDEPWNHQCRDAYHSMIRRVRKADGSWTFDYSLFDEYVEFGRSCGIGPHIACYTMCPWGYLVSWEDEDGKMQKREAKPESPFFREYWGPFLADFARHLKEKDWFDDTYIAMDERGADDVRIICSFIQEKAPGMKVSLAGCVRPSTYKGIEIDNYCQILHRGAEEYEAFCEEVRQRRAEGKLTTFYVCCVPVIPNVMMVSDPLEGFWLGAYPAVAGLDGFLRWAYNSWPQEPMKDASFGKWPAGDTFLVYPDGSPSVRFLELRNGIVAAEKFRILREAKEIDDAKVAELEQLFDVKEALKGTDWLKVRNRLQAVVNKVE